VTGSKIKLAVAKAMSWRGSGETDFNLIRAWATSGFDFSKLPPKIPAGTKKESGDHFEKKEISTGKKMSPLWKMSKWTPLSKLEPVLNEKLKTPKSRTEMAEHVVAWMDKNKPKTVVADPCSSVYCSGGSPRPFEKWWDLQFWLALDASPRKDLDVSRMIPTSFDAWSRLEEAHPRRDELMIKLALDKFMEFPRRNDRDFNLMPDWARFGLTSSIINLPEKTRLEKRGTLRLLRKLETVLDKKYGPSSKNTDRFQLGQQIGNWLDPEAVRDRVLPHYEFKPPSAAKTDNPFLPTHTSRGGINLNSMKI
jgi:hypothetical protein